MRAAKSGPVIYLREGHTVGMMLPLHPDVEARWRAGHLDRVHPDGSPWQDSDGDPFAVLSGEPAPAAASTIDHKPTTIIEPSAAKPADERGRPRGNASRADWAKFAVSLGMASEAEAALMTRDELRELTTPPELRPPDPDAA